MEVGNRGRNNRRSNKEPYKWKTLDVKNNPRPRAQTVYKVWKKVRQRTLKNCAAMGKTCKNYNKPNQFARMCQSQQINEVIEEISSSDEECNLLRCFNSCADFEIMA